VGLEDAGRKAHALCTRGDGGKDRDRRVARLRGDAVADRHEVESDLFGDDRVVEQAVEREGVTHEDGGAVVDVDAVARLTCCRSIMPGRGNRRDRGGCPGGHRGWRRGHVLAGRPPTIGALLTGQSFPAPACPTPTRDDWWMTAANEISRTASRRLVSQVTLGMSAWTRDVHAPDGASLAERADYSTMGSCMGAPRFCRPGQRGWNGEAEWGRVGRAGEKPPGVAAPGGWKEGRA